MNQSKIGIKASKSHESQEQFETKFHKRSDKNSRLKNSHIIDFGLKNFYTKTTNKIPMKSNQNGSLAIDSIESKIELDANHNRINNKLKTDDNNNRSVAHKLKNARALR